MRGDFPSTRAKAVESGLYKGDVLQPSSEQKVVIPNVDVNPEYSVGVFAGGVVSHLSFKEGNDTLSAITYFEQTSTRNVVNLFLGLFNGNNHKWVYDRVLIGHVLPQGFPVKQDNLLFNSVGNILTCHEWMTGKPIWDKRFNGDFLFSGFLIADNILVANCGDGYIYGLNPTTGDQLWKERSSGTSTRMHYQNGVVYYAGGGDGLLHAVEVATGKHLWKLQSPDVKQDSRAFYNGMVAGIGGQGAEKGKIFVNTGLHIYAYEAAR